MDGEKFSKTAATAANVITCLTAAGNSLIWSLQATGLKGLKDTVPINLWLFFVMLVMWLVAAILQWKVAFASRNTRSDGQNKETDKWQAELDEQRRYAALEAEKVHLQAELEEQKRALMRSAEVSQLRWETYLEEQHRTKAEAEVSRQLQKGFVTLVIRFRQVTADYLELARRFPNSEAVANPFAMRWRPSTGDVQINEDVRLVMAWHSGIGELIGDLKAAIPGADEWALVKAHRAKQLTPAGPTSVLGLLFNECETQLLQQIIPGL